MTDKSNEQPGASTLMTKHSDSCYGTCDILLALFGPTCHPRGKGQSKSIQICSDWSLSLYNETLLMWHEGVFSENTKVLWGHWWELNDGDLMRRQKEDMDLTAPQALVKASNRWKCFGRNVSMQSSKTKLKLKSIVIYLSFINRPNEHKLM